MNRVDVLLIVLLQWIYLYSAQMYMPLFLNYMPTEKCAQEEKTNETYCYKVVKKCNQCVSNCTVENSICQDQSCIDRIQSSVTLHSAAEDFGHYCNPLFQVVRTETVQYMGVFFGTIMFGTLSDIFGRKSVLLFGLIVGVPVMLASSEINNFYVFYICRFLTGLFNGNTMVVGWGLISELMYPDKRMHLRAFATYPMGRAFYTTICYLTKNWKWMNRIIAASVFPVIPVIYFLIPESHVFLASKGRQEEYEQSVDKMNWLAGFNYFPKKAVELKTKPEMLKTMKKVFTVPLLRKRILCLFSLWFVTFYTSYGLTLNSDTMFKSSFYIGQFILCGLLVCAKLGMGAMDMFLPGMNRRRLHQIFQGSSATALIVALVLCVLGQAGTIPSMISYMMASICIELCADICYLAVNELMPTEIRGVATGVSSMIGRFANILTAISGAVKARWEPGFYIILITFGVCNWFVSFFFLDETKGVDLNEVGKLLLDDPEKATNTRKGESTKLDEKEPLSPQSAKS